MIIFRTLDNAKNALALFFLFYWHRSDAALQRTLTDGPTSAFRSMICNLMLFAGNKVTARELFYVFASSGQFTLLSCMLYIWKVLGLFCVSNLQAVSFYITSLHLNCWYIIKNITKQQMSYQ